MCISPLKTTAAIGSGFPSFFLGMLHADSTTTRSIFQQRSSSIRRKETYSARRSGALKQRRHRCEGRGAADTGVMPGSARASRERARLLLISRGYKYRFGN